MAYQHQEGADDITSSKRVEDIFIDFNTIYQLELKIFKGRFYE